VAFEPVDESNTVIYLRNYQRFVNIPVLQELADWMMIFSKKVLNQDIRVVTTQRPIKAELKMEERLIPGDLPIITYRRIRENLKTQNR
jgi:phenylpropionate dioxygenase-like ring-hydroxylating dioxygenase large terminal subunit